MGENASVEVKADACLQDPQINGAHWSLRNTVTSTGAGMVRLMSRSAVGAAGRWSFLSSRASFPSTWSPDLTTWSWVSQGWGNASQRQPELRRGEVTALR